MIKTERREEDDGIKPDYLPSSFSKELSADRQQKHSFMKRQLAHSCGMYEMIYAIPPFTHAYELHLGEDNFVTVLNHTNEDVALHCL